MKLSFAAVSLSLFAPLAMAQDEAKPVDVGAAYREAYANQDREGLAALWTEYEGKILVTFDSDLEGGLSAWEKGAEGHEAKTAELFARALWGAEVASEVTGRRIYADYAAAFTGWNDEQRKVFRAGQKAFGAAMGAQGEEQYEEALKQGIACREGSMALGDWWGAAMGYFAEGMALHKLGRHDEASSALSLARLINRDLALGMAELRSVGGLIECLLAMDAKARALAAVQGAIPLARRLGQDERVKELLELELRLKN